MKTFNSTYCETAQEIIDFANTHKVEIVSIIKDFNRHEYEVFYYEIK